MLLGPTRAFKTTKEENRKDETKNTGGKEI
jgi:hypothetical protein